MRSAEVGANAFGQPVTRREDQRLLTGKGRFTADQIPEGAQSQGRLRGVGMAQYVERVAGGWAETAWIEMRQDGRLR
eukprot:gene5466-5522_t